MIPLAEARRIVLADLQPLAARPVPLADGAGCVLADAVVAEDPLPRFANSAMDGYAVVAADTTDPPVTLTVIGQVMAGDDDHLVVGTGRAVRIMTGAALPDGADAVCMVEDTTTTDDGHVVVHRSVVPGQHVRRAGEDVAAGSVVFEAGTCLTPAHVGVLASLGCDPVLVHPRPRVAVLSTGNELVEPGTPLGRTQIRDANRPSLQAVLVADGVEAWDLGIVPDDEDAVATVLTKAAQSADAIVTSGGVSVGDRDVVRIVLERMAPSDVRWMQVAIKPAKPLAFGRLGPNRTPIFGLPGNPVSALVSYELFVRPALRALAGQRRLDRPVLAATVRAPIRRTPDGKLHLVRVHVRTTSDGTLVAEAASGQGSHQLRSMADANALALVPDGDGVAAGATVPVVLLDPAAVPMDDGSPLGTRPGYDLVPAW